MSKLYWQNKWNFELNYSSNILFIIESEKCIYSYNNLRFEKVFLGKFDSQVSKNELEIFHGSFSLKITCVTLILPSRPSVR